MPITFSCACGQQLEMADEYAGRQARCPACQAVVTIPAAVPGPQRGRLAEPHEAGSLNQPERSQLPSRVHRDEFDEHTIQRRRQRESDGNKDDGLPIRSRPRSRHWLNTIPIGGIVCLIIALALLTFGVITGVYFKAIIFLGIAGVIGVIRGLITGRDE